MHDLFEPSSLATISGLRYIPNAISNAQESALMQWVDQQAWRDDLQRRVQHYGYRYDYTKRAVEPEFLGLLPKPLQEIAEQFLHRYAIEPLANQVIVNEYQPGQGIAAHIDSAHSFGPTIFSLSLAAAVTMQFKHPHTGETDMLYLEPCSVLILQEEARYQWQHAIAARKYDPVAGHRTARQRRVSLTFRSVL